MTMSAEGADAPLTVAVTRVVRAGREHEFEQALHAFVAASVPGKGQLGVHVIRPAPGDSSRRYGILRRFTDARARDAFYTSEAFAEWERSVKPLTEGERSVESISGLEAWFTPPGTAVVPPPRWKMALVTLLGVYPLSLILPPAMHRLFGNLPHALVVLVTAACMVTALTWLVMPNLSKLLHSWLHPTATVAP